jgi:spermidine synthase
VMICAMGVGSLAAKPLQRWPVTAFGAVEAALALIGGLSVMALYGAFAWLDLYQPALVATAAIIGILIGAEIPILTTLLHRIREDQPGHVVADLFAADYVGALIGGLAFPFLLLPRFGQLQGALVTGAVNLVAGGLVVGWLFRTDVERRARRWLAAAFIVVAGVLGFAAVMADDFEVDARQALYDDPIVHAERSAYQEIVLTRSRSGDVRLFLNGDLQLSSVDEYRYHESLVHPAMSGPRGRVLILGGGDGMAVREVLRYVDVEVVTLVDLDPAVVRLARADARLRDLNEGALDDARVEVISADAFAWLRSNRDPYDVVIADLPDPDSASTAKLYSTEIYSLVARTLATDGRLVVQAGSPYFAPDAYWAIERTVAAGGFSTTPYHVDVPSFGDWGFVLASPTTAPRLALSERAEADLRYLDGDVLAAAAVFPRDRARRSVDPSTLLHPTILEYARKGWRDY